MKALAVVGLIACLMSLPAFAGCVEPQAVPFVPDGATASRDDMLSAQKALISYNTVVAEYATCLEKRGGSASKQNEAVEKLRIVANRFNAELRAFRKRSGA